MSYKFTSSSQKAAFLALPAGASRQDIRNKSKFRKYAEKHAHSWYQFANGPLGREAVNGSLCLVTGCDKSKTWAAGAYSSASESNDFSFKFNIAKVGELGVAFNYSWDTDSSTTIRTGPELSRAEEALAPRNQCNFMRGFRVSVRDGPMAALMGPAKLVSIENSKPSSPNRGGKGGYVPYGDNSSTMWSWPSSNGSNSNGGGYRRAHAFEDEPEEDIHEFPLTDSGLDVTLDFIPGGSKVSSPRWASFIRHLMFPYRTPIR